MAMASKTTVYLLRHGHAYNNIRETVVSADLLSDAALTDIGKDQALLLKPQLNKLKIAAIYCSPLKRCRQTLIAGYPRSVYIDVTLDDRCLEHPYGIHICNRRAERLELLGSVPRKWDLSKVAEQNPHRVLSKSDEYQIIHDFGKEILKTHPGQAVLIVSHGRWISRFLKIFCGIAKVVISNCECLEIVIEDGVYERSNKRAKIGS
jgi:broad specificity phosphatase PhoE